MLRVLSVDWGSRFLAFKDAVKKPLRALNQMGAILKGRTKAGFQDQGRPAGSWPERAVPNVPGILQDHHEGADAPKSRRFDPRPALIDRGLMRDGVNHQVIGGTRLEVGMSGPAQEYVDKHQFGDPENETLPNTPEFKEWLWRWLQTSEGEPWKGRLGYLLNKARLGPEKWAIRARPIFVLTPEDVTDIAELTGVEIVNAAAGVQ